jgi:hypothetical protein
MARFNIITLFALVALLLAALAHPTLAMEESAEEEDMMRDLKKNKSSKGSRGSKGGKTKAPTKAPTVAAPATATGSKATRVRRMSRVSRSMMK